jgi:hypothetical protein
MVPGSLSNLARAPGYLLIRLDLREDLAPHRHRRVDGVLEGGLHRQSGEPTRTLEA